MTARPLLPLRRACLSPSPLAAPLSAKVISGCGTMMPSPVQPSWLAVVSWLNASPQGLRREEKRAMGNFLKKTPATMSGAVPLAVSKAQGCGGDAFGEQYRLRDVYSFA